MFHLVPKVLYFLLHLMSVVFLPQCSSYLFLSVLTSMDVKMAVNFGDVGYVFISPLASCSLTL